MDLHSKLGALSDLEILTLTIYGEARGESIEGQVAVASVIYNRSTKEGKSYRDICLAPKQFSCWNENDPNRPILLEIGDRMVIDQIEVNQVLDQCSYVAKGIDDRYLLDNVNHSRFYMTESLFNSVKRPDWSKRPTNVPKRIGNHIFFNV